MDKQVFISHSTKDKTIADLICQSLEANGIGCWVAPRDIPYGNDWAGEITNAIESSQLFVFILSESSNLSSQCPKEVSLADNSNITIFCIKIDDTELSPGLKYHLSSKQMMFIDISSIQTQIESFVQTVKNKLNLLADSKNDTRDNSQSSFVLHGGFPSWADEESCETTYNADEELDKRFDELFGADYAHKMPSKAKEKLQEIEATRFMSEFESKITPIPNLDMSIIDRPYDRPSLRTNEIEEYCDNGKHFSIPILEGTKTIVFQIKENQIDYKTRTKYNHFSYLEQEENTEGTEITVYLDTIPIEGASLLILHINYTKSKIYVNTGVLVNDSVLICKKPVAFSFHKMGYDGKGLALSTAAYDGKSVEFDLSTCSSAEKEEWVDADIKLAPAIIIDLRNAKPVLREIYYDGITQSTKARMKLVPHQNYFVFNTVIKGTNSPVCELSNYEKGRCYRKGINGFPKDILQAIDCLEKESSAESLFELSLVFDREAEYKDHDTYLDYLLRAIDLHSQKAKIELAIGVLDGNIKEKTIMDCISMLEAEMTSESTVLSFVLAYLLEETDIKRSFNCYFISAQNGYLPAIVRLQCSSQDICDDNGPELLIKFYKSIEFKNGIQQYCMGNVCYYGIGLESKKEYGLSLLKQASDNGDFFSQRALFEIYDEMDQPGSKEKSLSLLEGLFNMDNSYAVKLANRYIDGIGCEKNAENDKKAFDILCTMETSDDEVAINNLAWMLKTGKGCQENYKKAKMLFERSAEMGCISSFYHLGTIFEEGLGVQKDRAKAISYYQLAAERGHKKALEKINTMI